MMNIRISMINMLYGGEEDISQVEVHFTGNVEGENIQLNGTMMLTNAEYTGSEPLSLLKEKVRQYVQSKLGETEPTI